MIYDPDVKKDQPPVETKPSWCWWSSLYSCIPSLNLLFSLLVNDHDYDLRLLRFPLTTTYNFWFLIRFFFMFLFRDWLIHVGPEIVLNYFFCWSFQSWVKIAHVLFAWTNKFCQLFKIFAVIVIDSMICKILTKKKTEESFGGIVITNLITMKSNNNKNNNNNQI